MGKYREIYQNGQFMRIAIEDFGRLYWMFCAKFPKIGTGNFSLIHRNIFACNKKKSQTICNS